MELELIIQSIGQSLRDFGILTLNGLLEILYLSWEQGPTLLSLVAAILVNDEIVWIRGKKIRLTAAGHEYIDNLNEPEVWATIQENFSEAALNTVMVVAKDLAVMFAKKKLKL